MKIKARMIIDREINFYGIETPHFTVEIDGETAVFQSRYFAEKWLREMAVKMQVREMAKRER